MLATQAYHAVGIMELALVRFGTTGRVNTDQRSRFTAEKFAQTVLSRGAKLAVVGSGARHDKVFVERLWRAIKYEACLPASLRQRWRGSAWHC